MEKKKKSKAPVIVAAVVGLGIIGSAGNNDNDKNDTNRREPKETTSITTTLTQENEWNIWEDEETNAVSNLEYFSYNKTINDFISDYNNIAKTSLLAEQIKKGNINSKAIFSIDNCYVTVISSDNLYIDIDTYNGKDILNAEQITIDFAKVINPNIDTNKIKSVLENGGEYTFENGIITKPNSNGSIITISLCYDKSLLTEINTETTTVETTTIREIIETIETTTTTADTSPIVYITPTGEKYHYDNTCNGGTYKESTLNQAERLHLEPCNKCVY